MDSLPLIGPLKDHLWVATGFSAWGMTAGTAAALLVAEQMQGRSFGWGESFDPSRFPLTGTFVKENLKVAQRFVGGRFGTPPAAPEELDAGEAAVLKHDGEHVAAYRDDEGRLHAVSAVCTHLGCIVAWNSAELTWDCPCHGSRFAPDGAVVHAPAVDPLSPVEGAGESAT
jgi:Rieske Fe-S protein